MSRNIEQIYSSEKIFFSWPELDDDEINEVNDSLRNGVIGLGPKVKLFEEKISNYLGTNTAVCFNSATAAEELNLRVLGVKEGDEVIVPVLTYTASASAAIHAGAKVVFVDTGKDSPELDYEAVESAITPRTKAIVAVDIYGIMCDYKKLFDIVERKRSIFVPESDVQEALGRVAIIADAAHAFGASRDGMMAGNAADFTSFSFHVVKNLITVEGGASTFRSIPGISDSEIYARFQTFSNNGVIYDPNQGEKWDYDVISTGNCCYMTDIQAAIGLAQLRKYHNFLARRKEIISRYDGMAKELSLWHLNHYDKNSTGSGHLYIVRIPGIDEEKRNEIILKMNELKIPCNVHYKPLPMMMAYKNMGWNISSFPNAYEFYSNLISLPLYTILADKHVDRIIEEFSKVIKAN